MYFSTEILIQSFQLLGKIESNPEGKLRQEKVSSLSYLLATSEPQHFSYYNFKCHALFITAEIIFQYRFETD